MPWVQEIPPGKEPADLKPTDAVVHKITIDFVKPQERGR
jgi:hypothetical protein